MQITIIGAGNVATVLGKLIKKAGHEIVQVFSRNIIQASVLAVELHAEPIDDLKKLNNNSTIYLMAISDAALQETANHIHLKKGILLHTAGAVSKEILKKSSNNYGVLYPLQSLRKEKTDYLNIPFLIDANTPDNLALMEDFAKSISQSVKKAGDEERLKLHVAAVVVSNFTNYLYALAENYCKKENVSFNMLKPLITEVADRLNNHQAAEMQTGPAVRKDTSTIEKHLQLLEQHPDLQAVYAFLSKKMIG